MNSTDPSALRNSGGTDRTQQKKSHATAEEQMQNALARVESSRSALIVCLLPDPPERGVPSMDGVGNAGGRQSFGEKLSSRVARNGLLQGSWRTVRTIARRWWIRQPWHSSVDLLTQTLAHEARPLMRRHPLATLAFGAAVGAGLVIAVAVVRPWIWRKIGGKDTPWGNRVGSLLWTQATSAPVQLALAGALAAWLAERGRHKAPSDGASAADARPQPVTTNEHPIAAAASATP